ncbi:hypothetical protein ETZ92_011500 [Bacillus velezensis]|nr:hypothetical protein CEA92_10725 [Bacillus velezensis]QEQ04863.1 hypothetical protein ETZ92_011500 [Bacillus velezensis]
MKPPHVASAAGQIAASGHGADRLLSQGRRLRKRKCRGNFKTRTFCSNPALSESRFSWKKGKGVRPLPLSAFIIAFLSERTKSGPFREL